MPKSKRLEDEEDEEDEDFTDKPVKKLKTKPTEPTEPTFYYTYPTDNDPDVKDDFDEKFKTAGFEIAHSTYVQQIFQENDSQLCVDWKLRSYILESMPTYFTLCLVETGMLKCIMSVDFEYEKSEPESESESDMVANDFKITEITIVFYCCVSYSGRSKLLLHKLLQFGITNIQINSSNNNYWERIATKNNKYENKYTLTEDTLNKRFETPTGVELGESKGGKRQTKKKRKRRTKKKRKRQTKKKRKIFK